ncbi:MAG: MauE/DoxX family redox-associated membrane protein [Chitinophagaceae bacterium]
MRNFKKISVILIAALFILAGLNHFRSPAMYEAMIPRYFPFHSFINYTSGVLEFTGGVMMLFRYTRKLSIYLLVGLLIAFIPAHIYLIQEHGCVHSDICIPIWLAFVRLVPLQFLLMWWVWTAD